MPFYGAEARPLTTSVLCSQFDEVNCLNLNTGDSRSFLSFFFLFFGTPKSSRSRGRLTSSSTTNCTSCWTFSVLTDLQRRSGLEGWVSFSFHLSTAGRQCDGLPAATNSNRLITPPLLGPKRMAREREKESRLVNAAGW